METNPDFDQLRLFIFAQATLVDPLKPISNSIDPLSCNAKTLLSQLFDYIKHENLDKYNLIPCHLQRNKGKIFLVSLGAASELKFLS